ncbi:SART-1 family protein DOT2 [Linum grandiflorum]
MLCCCCCSNSNGQVDISADSRTSIRSIVVSSGPDSQFQIYVGTYSGSLLLLTTDTDSESNHDDDASKRKVSFMRSVSVGDSPVEAVLALAQIWKVVVISDGCLLLVDSLLDQQLKKLGFAKGVSAIAKRIVSCESDSSDLRSIVASNSESSTASQRILQRLVGGIRTNGVVKATQQTEDSSNNVFAIVLGVDLAGVKVLDGLDKVMEGGASILADGDINNEVDVLENVEIGEQKQRDDAYKPAKKPAGIYSDK